MKNKRNRKKDEAILQAIEDGVISVDPIAGDVINLRGGKWGHRPKVSCIRDRGDGYMVFDLSLDGKKYNINVHRAVWVAVNGVPEDDAMFVLHGDDNPKNNCITNLRLGTALNNSDDSARRGRSTRGERHPNSKLTYDRVFAILRHVAGGGLLKEAAVENGVCKQTITNLVRSHLPQAMWPGSGLRKASKPAMPPDELDAFMLTIEAGIRSHGCFSKPKYLKRDAGLLPVLPAVPGND